MNGCRLRPSRLAVAILLAAAPAFPSANDDLTVLQVWPSGSEICFEAPFARDWKAVSRSRARFDVDRPPARLVRDNIMYWGDSTIGISAPLPPEAADVKYLLVAENGAIEIRPARLIVTETLANASSEGELRYDPPQFSGAYCFPAKGLESFGTPAALIVTRCEVGFRRIPLKIRAPYVFRPILDRSEAEKVPWNAALRPDSRTAPPPALFVDDDGGLIVEPQDGLRLPKRARRDHAPIHGAALLIRATGAAFLFVETGESETCRMEWSLTPLGDDSLPSVGGGYGCGC